MEDPDTRAFLAVQQRRETTSDSELNRGRKTVDLYDAGPVGMATVTPSIRRLGVYSD